MTVEIAASDLAGGNVAGIIQAAVDRVSAAGGGKVLLPAGTFELRAPISLRNSVSLRGVVDKTRLRRCRSFSTDLARDTDWYESRVTVEDEGIFQTGDGLLLESEAEHSKFPQVTKHLVTAVNGREIEVNKQPRVNHWVKGAARASLSFSVIEGNEISHFSVEDLVIDGNGGENPLLDGNHCAGLFFQDCVDFAVRGVTVTNFNGDGISWQVCHDVLIENCRVEDCSDLGMHPGSGSQRSVIRHNSISNCKVGLFWCWGVRHGIAEGNLITGSREAGISIGHRDTDNVLCGNRVVDSGKVGILFRPERSADHVANRTRIEGNEIVNVGTTSSPGIAICLCRGLREIRISDNIMRNDNDARLVAIQIPQDVCDIEIIQNKTDAPVCDERLHEVSP